MSNLIYCLIAAPGEGKSTLAKQLCYNMPCLVYDVNGEWGLPTDLNKSRCSYFGDTKTFIEVAKNKHGGTFIVFEEATGFLQGRQQDEMRQLLIGKRHPIDKGGRNIVLLFHTIQSVPPFILAMSDFIVLWKTGDNYTEVKRKALKLLPYWNHLQGKPVHTKQIIKNI